MIKRILYSSPLFSGIFWVGLLTLAIPLSWRIVTGEWGGIPNEYSYDSNATPAALVVICLWLLIGYLHKQVQNHFKRMDEEEAAAVVAEPAPPPAKPPTAGPSQASPPSSPPRLGDLPPEEMWRAYNHAMLLLAKDMRWRKATNLGVLFEIDALGGGWWRAAYQVLFDIVERGRLREVALYHGDTQETLDGKARTYCIAIHADDPARLAAIREELAASTDPRLAPLDRRFVLGEAVIAEPLVRAGRIDREGHLVDCKSEWIHAAWQGGGEVSGERSEGYMPERHPENLDSLRRAAQQGDAKSTPAQVVPLKRPG